jgi:microcystin-dependent protein
MTTRSGNPTAGISGASIGTGSLPTTWEHPVPWDVFEKYFKGALNQDTRKVFNMLMENSKSLEDHLDTAYLKNSGGTVAGSATFTGSVTLPGTISLGGTLISTLNFPPTGSITMYGGSSAPAGWLRCDGTAISRATYPALFSIISTQYGAGNGSTTFNLPNLQGRFPLGGTSTRGATGGEENVTLTESQIPSHRHSGTTNGQSANHNHGVYVGMTMADGYLDTRFNFAGGTSGSNQGYGTNLQDYINNTALSPANSDHNHSFDTGYTGGGTSHNNMPPYQVVDYIIKT